MEYFVILRIVVYENYYSLLIDNCETLFSLSLVVQM